MLDGRALEQELHFACIEAIDGWYDFDFARFDKVINDFGCGLQFLSGCTYVFLNRTIKCLRCGDGH